MLEKARSYNLKLSPGKCEFIREEVAYAEHAFNKDGLKPDLEKYKEGNNRPSSVNQISY